MIDTEAAAKMWTHVKNEESCMPILMTERRWKGEKAVEEKEAEVKKKGRGENHEAKRD